MLTDDDFIDLNSKFNTSCKPSSRIFTLLTVPFGLFVLVFLCYLGFLCKILIRFGVVCLFF